MFNNKIKSSFPSPSEHLKNSCQITENNILEIIHPSTFYSERNRQDNFLSRYLLILSF
jgi:hypothetical protein